MREYMMELDSEVKYQGNDIHIQVIHNIEETQQSQSHGKWFVTTSKAAARKGNRLIDEFLAVAGAETEYAKSVGANLSEGGIRRANSKTVRNRGNNGANA
jgi:hypothetical protein